MSEDEAIADGHVIPLEPPGKPMTRAVAMPSDTNAAGDIFGGWLMSQMDLAAGSFAAHRADGGRTVTISVDGFIFHKPVFVGDLVSCYCFEMKRGRTSIGIHVEAWVTRSRHGIQEKVTQGLFTFVHVGEDRRPTPWPERTGYKDD